MIRIGIIGMGGFAGSHHQAVRQLEAAGECRLVCTCDPFPERFADAMREWDFAARGVRVADDYLKMLDESGHDLDMVVIPTPVPLHAEMHRACVARRLPVYLEKPPTLDYAELESMLAVEAGAVKQTQVGFNFIIETPSQTVKRRIVAGEFGPVREVRLLGLAPRTEKYFGRATWAGRLMLNDRLVLDSCLGNALAHYVHNQLFWAGTRAVDDWAEVESVSASLYRAHNIQGADTFFVQAQLIGGVTMRIALSHACVANQNEERIICDDAVIIRNAARETRIEWRDGRVETMLADERGLLMENHRAFYAYLRGERPRPITRLVDTRPFVAVNALSYIAAGQITPAAEPLVTRSVSLKDGTGLVELAGLEDAARAFLDAGRWPAPPAVAWGTPAGHATPADLPRLRDVVHGLCQPG